MDSWPYDDRQADKLSYKGKHRKHSHASPDYPCLQQGMVGAVTLAQQDRRLEWSFLRTLPNQESTKRWRLGNVFKAFPETRPPLPPKSRFGSKLSAQHGANFIRTCMPDTDIPAELIREQLEEEDVRLSQLKDLDPYIGNVLVSAVKQTTTNTATGFIAFPMGEVLSDLNISTLSITKETGVTIKPMSTHKREFPTPIQQIATTPLDNVHGLAVRTYDSIDYMRLNKSSPQSTWSIETVGKQTLADTHKREVMDLRLRSEQAVMVNDNGSLYSSRPFSPRSQVSHLSDMSEAEDGKDPHFWRLAFGQDQNDGYVVSTDKISAFDIRSGGSPALCFRMNEKEGLIASMEDYGPDGIVRFCSTNQIFWLDRRNMKKPLLSVRHYRQFDRTLVTHTLGGTSTLLTSRRNNMVSIYNVSRLDDGLLHIQNEPFGLLPQLTRSQCIGQDFVTSPFLPKSSHAIVLKLSDRGSLSGCSILSSEVEDDLKVVAKYTPALRTMEAQSWRTNDGLLIEQDQTTMNLRPAYEDMFRKRDENLEQREEDGAPQVYDLLEQIPTFFQQSDVPSEQMLTTYDVAFRAGNEPKDTSRSDFLTGSVLSSQRGHRALRQGRLDPNSLSSKAPWHLDLGSTLTRFGVAEGISETEGIEEPFIRYNLKDDEKRTVESVRLEKRYREQLEVDLRLFRDVFSTHPFAKPGELDQTLETMTEALSLGNDEPPEVEFGFLRPVKQEKANGEGDEAEGTEQGVGVGLGLGVKLLLKDWEVGTDPADYIYQDPYNTVESRPMKVLPRPMVAPKPTAAPPQLLTQRDIRAPALQTFSQLSGAPPQLLTQKTLRSPISSRAFNFSQPPALQKTTGSQETQSQDVSAMASTQILPGPFGGRPTKKKSEKKKRMGGF